ncbi:Altered inheritance of mitochondria protein 6 [Arachnomyces sp. PD_36]|nr:Altered inheritance of mitochondria protein 6 [Arachnomyces sp. PD_36]
MWVFSSFWRSRQKKAMRQTGGSEGNIDDPYRDTSRDPSLSNDNLPSRYTDIESGRCLHYRDNSVDSSSSVNGNSSGNIPILARNDRHSALKPIVTSYWVESDPSPVLPPSRPRWTRFLPCFPIARAETGPILSPDSPTPSDRTCAAYFRKAKKSPVFRWIVFLIFLFFVTLGLLQFATLIFGVVAAFFPDDVERVAAFWRGGEVTERLSQWPTEYTRDIKPARCHSHNDYWRLVPLYSALHAGCISVEADVWMFDGELFVGHSLWSLNHQRTLRTLYVDPLVKILDSQNQVSEFSPEKDQPLHGVFDTEPSQQLVLLVDFKNDGAAIWPHLVSQLAPLRDRGYLTYFNGTDVVPGPLIVVGTGNAPFDLLTANSTYRDIFFDAPLDELDGSDSQQDTKHTTRDPMPIDGSISGMSTERALVQNQRDFGNETATSDTTEPYNAQNSYFASVSFSKTIGSLWDFRFSEEQLNTVRTQIRNAHERGLQVRYWNLPSWPRLLRNHVWTVLVREGVDLLNADDLKGATMEDWVDNTGIWKGWLWW